MRTALGRLSWGLVATLGLVAGCEDGPKQNFDPNAPVSNGNGTNPQVDLIPKQPLGGTTGGASALVRCTPEKQRRVWASELIKPIVPVRGAAGLDGTKDLTYTGLSIDEVEAALCQGAGGTGASSFGEQGELVVSWSASTRLVTQFAMFSGYRGTLSFTDPVTMDKFTISLESKPIDINGQPLRWNWRDTQSNVDNVTKIWNAMMRVYAPDQLPKDPVTDCRKIGACVIAILGSGQTGAFAISPLSFMQFYFDLGVDDTAGKDILTRVYVPIQKNFAYSSLPFLARLPGTAEADGAQVFGQVGAKTCVAKPGMFFKDFIDNCIAVSGDATKDAAETRKFLSGLRHSSENYIIDVVGVDPVFLSDRIRKATDPASVTDADRPEPNDPLETLTVDQQLNGPIVNDYPNEDPSLARDNHASGLVNLTYAILVQQALDAADKSGRTKHPIGDPACRVTPLGLPVTPAANGCTGMEGFVTTAPPGAVDPNSPWANVALGKGAIGVTTGSGLAPANNQVASWSDNPAGPYVFTDALQKVWAGSAARVIKVLGQGKRFNVPSAFREPRAYATIWMQALTQYMIARGNVGKNVKLQDVLDAGPGGAAAHHIDPNYFFFDAPDGNRQQFDSAEYVYTDFATVDRPWYDLRIVVDANGGILNQLTFDAYPLRGERALLGALALPGQPLGAYGTLLQTNIFGSSVLSNGWRKPAKPLAPYLTAYDCASADTEKLDAPGLLAFKTACGAGNGPPLDANGKVIRNASGDPWLKPYRGGFGSTATVFNLGRNIGTIPQDQVQFLARDVNLLQAKVAFRTKADPYGPASPEGPLMPFPINYIIPTDFTGFFIPINASRDRFVREEEIQTTGVAISTVIGTVPVLKDGLVVPGLTRLASADSQDFLGEVFVCKSGGDLLAVRMFTPADVVLEWINNHPSAVNGCNLIIDYFEFGSVISRVTSITNGVIVNFTRPSGITAQANNSAVSDVDFFAPGL